MLRFHQGTPSTVRYAPSSGSTTSTTTVLGVVGGIVCLPAELILLLQLAANM